jgi:hypothetical protein
MPKNKITLIKNTMKGTGTIKIKQDGGCCWLQYTHLI